MIPRNANDMIHAAIFVGTLDAAHHTPEVANPVEHADMLARDHRLKM